MKYFFYFDWTEKAPGTKERLEPLKISADKIKKNTTTVEQRVQNNEIIGKGQKERGWRYLIPTVTDWSVIQKLYYVSVSKFHK